VIDFDELCDRADDVVNGHQLDLLVVSDKKIAKARAAVAAIVPAHYASPKRVADILAKFGKKKAAKFVREKLPLSVKIRSGDLGEILATEYVDEHTAYEAPIKRLRWKDHREMSMRGDDLIAITLPSKKQPIGFLKVEAKSRSSLKTKTIAEAREALDGDGGLPSPHALAFIADRLHEMGEEELSDLVTLSQLNEDISTDQVQHLIFTFSGNAPDSFLKADLKGYSGGIRQNAVGLRVTNHKDFVAAVFDAPGTDHDT
jgi:Cap4 SAVED domain